jgi:hypothetical protein
MKRSRMTVAEKTRLRTNIMSAMNDNTRKNSSRISPYLGAFGIPSYLSRFSWNTFSKVSLVSALSMILVVGGLTYASAGALPGDLLYPIKISKEKIEEKLTFAPAQKIALRQKRIDARFTEVEQLIKENRITPENRSIANSEIQVEKEKITNDIEAVNEGNPAAAAQAKMKLESSIDSRQTNIDNQIETNKDVQSIGNDLSNFNKNLNAQYQTDSQLIDSAIPTSSSTTSSSTDAGASSDTTKSNSSTDSSTTITPPDSSTASSTTNPTDSSSSTPSASTQTNQ